MLLPCVLAAPSTWRGEGAGYSVQLYSASVQAVVDIVIDRV
jgi:hypothetical protein